jgi:hypothetical protein
LKQDFTPIHVTGCHNDRFAPTFTERHATRENLGKTTEAAAVKSPSAASAMR